MPEKHDTATEVVRLEPGPHDTHELYAAILAEPCPDCGAHSGAHCVRSAGLGAHGMRSGGAVRYETRLAHESRITAASAKRASP